MAGEAFVTGTTAVGFRYKDGVILAADRALSYGHSHLATDYDRIVKISDHCAVVFSGDEADMRDALQDIHDVVQQEMCFGGAAPSARAIHGHLGAICYYQRSQADPYMNSFLVGGPNFLGTVDLYGTTFETNFFATSIGRYYAMPLLAKEWRADLTREEALKIVAMIMSVMRKNDCLAGRKYQVAFLTQNGFESERYEIPDEFPIAGHRDLREFV